MTRGAILTVAVALLLVTGLVVGIVSMTRWTYAGLRRQAERPLETTAMSAPASIGPAVTGPAPPGPAEAEAVAAPDASDLPLDVPLRIPIDGLAPADLYPSFDEARGGRRHDAIDILAPRGTPVRAVAEGRIARLFTSDAGGLTVYQFDREERVAYYYAHLDRYEFGLTEGAAVRRGDILGYVGSTGNARAEAPHLHFAVYVLGPEKRWWEGRAIDPYPLLGGQAR